MATIPLRTTPMAGFSRVARQSYRVIADIPSIPLLMVSLLTFAAVFAPVLAPHSKLTPVKPAPPATTKPVAPAADTTEKP